MTHYIKEFTQRRKRSSWFCNIFIGIITSFFFIMLSYSILVSIFDKILPHISYAQEEKIWNYIKPSFGFDENYKIQDLYEADRIALQTLVDEFPPSLLPKNYEHIEILIMNDSYVNAFAAPGGKIILTTALLDSLDSENALVFVIGHEMGHFHNKDHLHEFGRVLSASLFSATSGSANSLLTELILIFDSKDSRSREFIADKFALNTLLTKYGHVGGAIDFFNVLLELGDEENNYFLESIASHPSTVSRIEEIQRNIKNNNLPIRKIKLF